jgi:uncharacterized protein YjbI with pentapeptide repeats
LLTQCFANGELAGGAIGDLDVEVKWGCPCEEFCPGGDSCVLEVEQVMELIKLRVEELLQRYGAGERDFSNCMIVGELRGINLEGAKLINSDLAERDMSGANLAGTDLTGACLEQTLLHNVNLSNANLSGAFVNEAQFIEANLTNAYLINASDIGWANFCKANLTNTNLRNAMDERDPIILQDAIFCSTIMPDGSIRN